MSNKPLVYVTGHLSGLWRGDVDLKTFLQFIGQPRRVEGDESQF